MLNSGKDKFTSFELLDNFRLGCEKDHMDEDNNIWLCYLTDSGIRKK